jgi:chemotaxis protein histidine kinase CheA
MPLFTDPDMADVVDDFIKESDDIYNELEEILEDYEDDAKATKLEKFGQTIDRVMGAAKSIEANKTGLFCELGKTISYKASQSQDDQLLKIVVAILFDTIEILKFMNKNILIEKEEKVDGVNLEAFTSRLHWLADKFKNIQRSSVAIDDTSLANDQKSIDQLLKDLGL